MTSNLKKWLDSKVFDNSIRSVYDINDDTIKHYPSHYKKDIYYNFDDDDIHKSDKLSLNVIINMSDDELESEPELKKLSNYVDHILLNPNTNRYHANYLFRQLIDNSYDNEYDYNIYNMSTKSTDLMNLIDKSLKESFYKFCYDNSSK